VPYQSLPHFQSLKIRAIRGVFSFCFFYCRI
jgi:hypothetical protein